MANRTVKVGCIADNSDVAGVQGIVESCWSFILI
jgi:hypothetical protein